MKHIAPASVIKAPPRVKYLHCALTHKVITSRTVGLGDPFDGSWIREAVASWLDVHPDKVSSMETDEYPDGIAVDGELVAYVEEG